MVRLSPLMEVWIIVPPPGESHHRILPFNAVPVMFVFAPHEKLFGEAVTGEGAGIDATVTVTDILETKQVSDPCAQYVVVVKGLTMKFPPFKEVSSMFPPVAESNHFTEVPVEVAFKIELFPQ